MRIKVRLLVLTLFVSIVLCQSVLIIGYDGDEHDRILEQVLLGEYMSINSLPEEGKNAVKALEEASALVLDQFNGNNQNDLDSLRKKVKKLPVSIQEINFTSNSEKHRSFTHKGWDDSYYTKDEINTSKWSLRKDILNKTVNQLWTSDKNKGPAFAKLIYYIHVLSDYQYDRQEAITKKLGLDKKTNLSNIEITKSVPKMSSSAKDTAEYIYKYKKIPDVYISKKEARALGWKNEGKTLDEVAPGKMIGGDEFKNYSENGIDRKLPLLPDGKKYYECDIDYSSGDRGPNRIVCALYTDKGVVYYTDDHYNTFYLLYPELYKKKSLMIALGGRNDNADIADELLTVIDALFIDNVKTDSYDALRRGIEKINSEIRKVQSLQGDINTNGRWLKYYGYADELLKVLSKHLPVLLENEEFFQQTISGKKKKGFFIW